MISVEDPVLAGLRPFVPPLGLLERVGAGRCPGRGGGGLAVLKMLSDYRDRGGSFLYLVRAIAANKVADAVRTVAPAQPGAELLDRRSGGSDTDSTVQVWDLGARPGELLAQLPRLHKEVLTLRIVVGRSATETAEARGISPGNVCQVLPRPL